MQFDNQNIMITDVSFYQIIRRDNNGKLLPPEQWKFIDFNKMKDEGISACVIRAGQDYYKDVAFDYSWRDAKAAGMPRASYWFLDKDNSPYFQARKYWEIMKLDIGEGFLCGDIEIGSPTDWNNWYIFFNELQQISQLPSDKIFLYTNYYFWMEHRPKLLSQQKWFSEFPLWMASYTNPIYTNLVKIPPEWSYATLWQYGTPAIGKRLGVWTEEIDMNILNGGQDILKKHFGSSIIIPDPTPIITFPYELITGNNRYKK